MDVRNRISVNYTAHKPSTADPQKNALSEYEQHEALAFARLRHLTGILTLISVAHCSEIAWGNVPATKVSKIMDGIAAAGELALQIRNGLMEDLDFVYQERQRGIPGEPLDEIIDSLKTIG